MDTQRLEIIPNNNTGPFASADYQASDITSTAISVVLETVVDGSKIHLTEKILRPIACGHPFVLAAGPGSLNYLRRYGFQTFESVFDESYDLETNTVARLELIVQTMQQVQKLSPESWQEINAIAAYNKQHFFSDKFTNQVTAELQSNLDKAVEFNLDNRGDTFWQWRKIMRRTGLCHQYSDFKSERFKNTIRELRKYRLRRSHNSTIPIIGQ